ncbi:hypothetical protein DFP72DRAFT_1057072, partial [Ephemerocybe angulata]
MRSLPVCPGFQVTGEDSNAFVSAPRCCPGIGPRTAKLHSESRSQTNTFSGGSLQAAAREAPWALIAILAIMWIDVLIYARSHMIGFCISFSTTIIAASACLRSQFLTYQAHNRSTSHSRGARQELSGVVRRKRDTAHSTGIRRPQPNGAKDLDFKAPSSLTVDRTCSRTRGLESSRFEGRSEERELGGRRHWEGCSPDWYVSLYSIPRSWLISRAFFN